MERKHYGLILEPLKPTDFVLGTSQSLEAKYGAEAVNPSGDWSNFTPSEEDQSTMTGDTWACTNFNTIDAVEMLHRLQYGAPLNLSDRFSAVMSGTKPGVGNSPQKAADSLRRDWSVLEPEWPDVNTVEEFFAPIPASLKTLAVGRGAEFEFGYQVVPNSAASIKAALRTSPVCIAVTAWVEKNGVYVRGDFSENHWTTIIKVLDNGNYKVFDSFYPFIKEVHPSAAQSLAMSYYLKKQIASEGAWRKFLRLLASLFAAPAPIPGMPERPPFPPIEPPVEPPKPPVPAPKPVPAKSKLEPFCLAVRAHEGWYAGSRSWRNNNPGNCRYSSVGYAKMYGHVGKDDKNFAVFRDYATGWLYLNNLVKAKISANPSQDFYAFFEVYAPSFENDSKHYAAVVAKACGLKPTDPVSKVL